MQIVVVLMFLMAIILYRTILSMIIYKSEHSFLTFSVSTRKHDSGVSAVPVRLRDGSLRNSTAAG